MRTFTSTLILTSALPLSSFITGCSKNNLPDITAPTELSEAFILDARKHPETMKKHIFNAFDDYANSNGIISRETVDKLTQIQLARKRSEIIGNFYRLDLDGSGDISPTEFVGLSDRKIASWSSRQGSKSDYTKADTNKDGSLTSLEIQTFAQQYVTLEERNNFQNPILYIMAFDTDADGSLTRTEFSQSFDARFNEYMTINSSPPHETESEERDRKEEIASKIDTCRPSIMPSAQSDIIIVSGYGGAGQSSVAVTGVDEKTDLGRIRIEAGTTPIYIIASSVNPMIWSLEGATTRVEGFVSTKASKNKLKWGGVGVVGLSIDKLAFTPFDCVGHIKSDRSKLAILANSMYEKIFERPLKNIISVHYFDPVSLPSGDPIFRDQILKSEHKAAKNGVEDLKADNGVIIPIRNKVVRSESSHLRKVAQENQHIILSESVISPGKVESYEIYPNHSGLKQLVEQGKLELLDDETFLIKEEIPRLPAGLTGNNKAHFILKSGVPFPEGKLGHSSIVNEKTGECLAGSC